MVESRDDASITIEGYSEPSSLGSIETFEVSVRGEPLRMTQLELKLSRNVTVRTNLEVV